MKQKYLVLVSFLLMLYIVPMFLMVSYGSATIPIEQNTSKDFIPSAGSWLTGWDKRKAIELNGSSGAGTNYQVNITNPWADGMQIGHEDVRFTDDDGITLLDYWREYYDENDENPAGFWVKVNDNLDTNQTIYMYWDTEGESTTTSNGTDTFIFFDDFENNNLDRWDTAQFRWSTTGAQKKYGDYSAFGDSYSSNRELSKVMASPIQYGIMVHSWLRFQSTVGTEYPLVAYEEDTTLIYVCHSPLNEFSTFDGIDTNDYFVNGQTASVWIEAEIGLDWVGKEFVPFFDGVEKTHYDLDSSDASATVTDIDIVGSVLSSDIDKDHWLDDYYIRKWIVNEPFFVSFGEEEEEPPPPDAEWNKVGEAELIFSVPVFEGALNALLIFLGLIMIPVSTLYLVKGGKDEMSTDKLFYVIIVFVMGWALFLGGIYG